MTGNDTQRDYLKSELCTFFWRTINQSFLTYDDLPSDLVTTGPPYSGEVDTIQPPYGVTVNPDWLATSDEDEATTKYWAKILYQKVVIAICCLGVIGNILNLVVLTRKGILHSLGRIEKFVYTGLTALALSDMFFCLAVIPHGFLPPSQISARRTVAHFYHAYSNGVINTFMMASTWLTVVMAVGRYFVARAPFRAREIIGMTFAVRVMAAVFTLCVLFNLPRFWFYVIDEITCPNGDQHVFVFPGYVKANVSSYKAYMWTYFCVCIMLPLLLLMYCNAGLIRALRHVMKNRREVIGRTGSTHAQQSSHRANTVLTLIVIVIMFIFLVCPAEIITFLGDMSVFSSSSYDLTVACVNTLQALNFALNFVLYYAINANFRRTTSDLVHCRTFQISSGMSMRQASGTMVSTRVDITSLKRNGGREDAV